jgi:hypothetical protein
MGSILHTQLLLRFHFLEAITTVCHPWTLKANHRLGRRKGLILAISSTTRLYCF